MDYLIHYGIKGQKWGIRRSEKQLARSRGKILTPSEDAKKAAALSKKKTAELSNTELKELNTRKELEKKRRDLNPSSFKKGVAFASGAAAIMGTSLALYRNSEQMVTLAKKAINPLMKKKVLVLMEGAGI